MPRQRRLVVPPAPLRALRSHRLLRLVAEPARKRSCQRERPHSPKKFRARRGLVLRLWNRRRHGRSSVSGARAPSAQAADAGSCRQGAARLAAPPPLTGDIGVRRRGPRPPKALLAPEPQQVRRFTGCDPIPSRGRHVDFVAACAFLGACAGRRAVGDAAFSASDQRSCCLRRANHQDMVTAFHLAVGKYWSVGRDQGRPRRLGQAGASSAKRSAGYGPDVIGNNVFCHSGPADWSWSSLVSLS
jgi:hypothetical protein